MKRRFKPRLQRLKWLFTGYPVYFLTFCTEPRRAILDNHPLHNSFIAFAQKAADFKVLTGYHMIMPDHVHLFAAFQPESLPLPKWMKSLKNSLSKTLRGRGVLAPHWEKDYFDHLMRSKESYLEKLYYVQQNPVRAGLVKRAEDWPYQGEIFKLDL